MAGRAAAAARRYADSAAFLIAARSASTLSASPFFALGQSGCDAIEPASGLGCGAGAAAVCAFAAPQQSKAANAAEHTEITRTKTPPEDSPEDIRALCHAAQPRRSEIILTAFSRRMRSAGQLSRIASCPTFLMQMEVLNGVAS